MVTDETTVNLQPSAAQPQPSVDGLCYSMLAGGLARRFLSLARRRWATGKRRNRFCYTALHFEPE